MSVPFRTKAKEPLPEQCCGNCRLLFQSQKDIPVGNCRYFEGKPVPWWITDGSTTVWVHYGTRCEVWEAG